MKSNPGAILSFFILSLSSTVRGEMESVVFDAGFTNRTEWTVSSNFLYSTENKAWYFTARNSPLVSPLYPFTITSITANAWMASYKTRRKLYVAPIDASGRTLDEDVRDITPPDEVSSNRVDCAWDPALKVRGLRFYMGNPEGTNAAGNVYLHSAVIRGTRDGFSVRLH